MRADTHQAFYNSLHSLLLQETRGEPDYGSCAPCHIMHITCTCNAKRGGIIG